jgi:Trypsin-like peptidase domain
MRKVTLALIIGACTLSAARATININTEAVKQCVVFIYPAGSDGKPNTAKPDATGFLVSVPTTAIPPRYYWLLVTARHVFDPQWTGCPGSGTNPEKVFMRVNTLQYDPAKDPTGVDYVEIDLMSQGKPTFAVGNDDSDVAMVLLYVPKLTKYALNTVQLKEFGTDDDMKKLSIGDDVVSAGLMPGYTGIKRNYPIFKFGKVSNVPDEPVPVDCGARSIREVFIAANMFPGSSGSPVFIVAPGGNGVSFGGKTFLMGIQSNSYIPADVAGVTPVTAILDAIKSMQLSDANLTH